MKRTIVVTGAAAGIGRSTVELLEKQGHRVIGVDLHNAEVIADLSNVEGRKAMVEAIREKTNGVIDGVFANAGSAAAEPFTLSVNYFGVVETLEAMRPMLAKGDNPRVVITTSVALTMSPDLEIVEACLEGDEAKALAATEGKNAAIYSSSKRAVARWLRRNAIAPEWAGAGILLNAIAPGIIATNMTEAIIADKAQMEYLGKVIPMPIGRFGQPPDIGHLAAYLLSAENRFMVGQVIFVDGGGEATNYGENIWEPEVATPELA